MIHSTLAKEFIEERKQSLLARKTELEEQLASFATRDPHQKSNYNTEYPEFGTKEEDNAAEVAVFESNLSLEETLEQSLEMINKALVKIDDDTYGLCVKCGQPIEEERLKIMPTATRCASTDSCGK